MDKLVTIKSCRYGMEIHMDPDVDFETLLEHMQERFQNSARFFQGAQMAVSFFGRRLSYTEEQRALYLISESTGIDIVCVIDNDQEHELSYKSIVERTLSHVQQNEGQFYRGTLGKKQVIESDTSIVILGDVELGAKVIAKGNIVIVGSLRGSAHAGAAGDQNAYIVALSMNPKSLRIGDVEARRQTIYQENQHIHGPKIAVIDGTRIYLDPLVD
ncbi:MAG: septum formation inhibitor [Ruminococcus sp.]|nr:septum formation inhibitor [Ruminococcus sp.]